MQRLISSPMLRTALCADMISRVHMSCRSRGHGIPSTQGPRLAGAGLSAPRMDRDMQALHEALCHVAVNNIVEEFTRLQEATAMADTACSGHCRETQVTSMEQTGRGFGGEGRGGGGRCGGQRKLLKVNLNHKSGCREQAGGCGTGSGGCSHHAGRDAAVQQMKVATMAPSTTLEAASMALSTTLEAASMALSTTLEAASMALSTTLEAAGRMTPRFIPEAAMAQDSASIIIDAVFLWMMFETLRPFVAFQRPRISALQGSQRRKSAEGANGCSQPSV
eukprot:CAMPEP_0174300436 /NCGR_PEP_ID=MMETSP0809-20121228/58460_1 /TAXON_ID=73025 ORGANISM="Eutreptiella gymnastica-like, Strain CCMP1594" /NCGR_SAMPLE_ID=MMETSP0809 /ASSEMBLY_ACC=CAM_ASM_000658 /LENGTH=277 /DNA_ID=CAMNT_0015406009 /DNA_START=24 /DNA_END=859 /DNA_ORIENTATION=-